MAGPRDERDRDEPRDHHSQRSRRGAGAGRPKRGNPGTGGAFGLSSTRRAALLAIVVCALALSIAVPLRTYLGQREQVQQEIAKQEQLRREVSDLEQRKAQMQDPAQVEAKARERLGYVRPGETPYVVQLPSSTAAPPSQQPPQPAAPEKPPEKPWYERLWNSITGNDE